MSSPNSTERYHLGINTGFAVNRYSEHEEWIRIVGEDLGLRRVQFTADMLNVDLPDKVIASQTKRIVSSCQKYDVNISSTFTGGFTRVNHLAHPDIDIRNHWIEWFKKFVDLSVNLGAISMGSHFGIFTHLDNSDPKRRAERRRHNIEGWHRIGEYASKRGLEYLSWEPMSISREQGETLALAMELQDDVNREAPIPFKVCLDVDHGDVSSTNPDDTKPYVWLEKFAKISPLIHLKQSYANKGGHWPFTAEHNAQGQIKPELVVEALTKQGITDVELILELSFREREPVDSTVIEVLKESVDYWRQIIKN